MVSVLPTDHGTPSPQLQRQCQQAVRDRLLLEPVVHDLHIPDDGVLSRRSLAHVRWQHCTLIVRSDLPTNGSYQRLSLSL